MPIPADKLMTGNAYTDGAARGGWFVASFIDEAFGVRRRDGRHLNGTFPGDFELKMKEHPLNDQEGGLFPDNNTATSMSMIVGKGRFELFFCYGAEWQQVTLEKDGDYAIWEPGVGHYWRVPVPSTIFTVRVPAIPKDQTETPLEQLPAELRDLFEKGMLERREKTRLEKIEQAKNQAT